MTTITGMDSKLAQSSIAKSKSQLSSVVSNLVSGKKSDANVADFSVGTVLSTKVGVLKTATLNAGQAKSLLATAKGGLETINTLLNKQKNLATKASDDSLSDNERGFLNQEFQSLTKEINRIAENTNFNGKNLIDGSISGKASGTSKTTETTENFTLAAAGQYRLAGAVSAGNLASGATTDSTDNDTQADGNIFSTFSAVASGSIGISRAVGVIDVSLGSAPVGGAAVTGASISVGGSSVTFGYTETASATTSAQAIVTAAVTALNASTDTTVNKFRYAASASGTQIVATARDLGTAANSVTFQFTNGGAATVAAAATLGTNTIVGGTSTLGTDANSVAAATNGIAGVAGANRSGTGTFDANIQGSITDISATLSVQGGIKFATFSAKVNDVTYTSNAVALQDTGSATVINAGQDITFFNANGTKDTSGNLTDSGFKLTVGSSDVNIAGTGVAATNTAVQNGLNTFATNIETQLQDASIVQERSIATTNVSETDNTIKSGVGTVLEGLKGYNTTGDVAGALRVRSDKFGSDGSFGSIGSFSYNKDTFKLTTTVDGVTYTADLSDTSTSDKLNTDRGLYIEDAGVTGSSSSFSTSTKVLTLNDEDTVHIVLNSETEGDGKQLILELANQGTAGGVTNTVDLSTDTAAENFASTLSSMFGSSGANNSLNFQVGTQVEDAIGVSIGGAKTSDLYKDDEGVTQSLDISTLAGAQGAGEALDNAINKTISLLADVNAVSSSFDAAISNNEASMQNADSARSVLLDTDYSQESTRYAETTVKYDAAASILAQVNQRMQNLLQLLRF